MEPLFCKNTGGYLAETAYFCAQQATPKPPFRIIPPSIPKNIDTLSWVKQSPEELLFRIHPDAEVFRNVRSILDRKKTSITLLINQKAKFFVELDFLSEEFNENFIPLLNFFSNEKKSMQANQNLRSLAVCLVRHHLLESNAPELLHSELRTGQFILEEGARFFEQNGQSIGRNKFSGRAFRIEPSFRDLLLQGPLKDDCETNLSPLIQTLCQGGILRQVIEKEGN